MDDKSLIIIQADGSLRNMGIVNILDVVRLELKLHAAERTGQVILSNGLKYQVTEDTVKRIFRHESDLIEFNRGNGLLYWLSFHGDDDDETYKAEFRDWALASDG